MKVGTPRVLPTGRAGETAVMGWRALVKMTDVSFNRIQVYRLNTKALMQDTNSVAHLIQKWGYSFVLVQQPIHQHRGVFYRNLRVLFLIGGFLL